MLRYSCLLFTALVAVASADYVAPTGPFRITAAADVLTTKTLGDFRIGGLSLYVRGDKTLRLRVPTDSTLSHWSISRSFSSNSSAWVIRSLDLKNWWSITPDATGSYNGKAISMALAGSTATKDQAFFPIFNVDNTVSLYHLGAKKYISLSRSNYFPSQTTSATATKWTVESSEKEAAAYALIATTAANAAANALAAAVLAQTSAKNSNSIISNAKSSLNGLRSSVSTDLSNCFAASLLGDVAVAKAAQNAIYTVFADATSLLSAAQTPVDNVNAQIKLAISFNNTAYIQVTDAASAAKIAVSGTVGHTLATSKYNAARNSWLQAQGILVNMQTNILAAVQNAYNDINTTISVISQNKTQADVCVIQATNQSIAISFINSNQDNAIRDLATIDDLVKNAIQSNQDAITSAGHVHDTLPFVIQNGKDIEPYAESGDIINANNILAEAHVHQSAASFNESQFNSTSASARLDAVLSAATLKAAKDSYNDSVTAQSMAPFSSQLQHLVDALSNTVQSASSANDQITTLIDALDIVSLQLLQDMKDLNTNVTFVSSLADKAKLQSDTQDNVTEQLNLVDGYLSAYSSLYEGVTNASAECQEGLVDTISTFYQLTGDYKLFRASSDAPTSGSILFAAVQADIDLIQSLALSTMQQYLIAQSKVSTISNNHNQSSSAIRTALSAISSAPYPDQLSIMKADVNSRVLTPSLIDSDDQSSLLKKAKDAADHASSLLDVVAVYMENIMNLHRH